VIGIANKGTIKTRIRTMKRKKKNMLKETEAMD